MSIPFLPPLEPMMVMGEDSGSLHENQQPEFEAYFGGVIGANDGTFQAQSDNIQDSLNEYLYGGFPAPGPGPVDLGGPSCPSTSARARVSIESIKMISPEVLDERPIEHRRETQIKLEIIVSAEPLGVDPPGYCIRVPRTKSVKKSGSRGGRTVLDLKLEVLGATTGKALMFTCRACSIRESSPSASVSMVDFVAKEDLINGKNGKVSIAFRFLCLPVHHGTMDEEYELRAKIMKCDQVLELHTFPNRLRIVSHLDRRRNAPPAILPQGIETSTVAEFPFNSADIQDTSNPRTESSDSSGTSARETRRSVRVQSESSLEQNPTVDVSAPITPASDSSEPAGQQGHSQASAAPVNEHMAEEGPLLSRVVPRRGSVSGGEEIVLIVSNLPSTIKLYARFGCNIALTAHLSPGVLFCLLPPAAGPGMVKVTLCQAPSTNAEPYGRSLASFEYEADSTKAVSILMKVLNSKDILESMPLIQRLLQSDAGSPSLDVEPGLSGSNMSLRSSLPESAFLGILSALKHLPDLPRLLATVNEQGQTLLHLAVHLRYRELVQKLIHWGIDPNIRDVNGCTALHAAYLCGDLFVVDRLEAEGATPFVLDDLGRPPAQLAISISSDDGTTTVKDEELVPEGYVDQSKEQSKLPDRAMPTATQETAFGTAAEKIRPSETLLAVSPGHTTQSPQSIDEHLIHVNPGHVVPLHNRHRTQDLLYLDTITLQPVLDRGYTFKLFIENEELELGTQENQTWTPAQRPVVYLTSEMRAEIHMGSATYFWERSRLASEVIDLQALFDGYWNSNKHKFTVLKIIVVGNHHWSLEIQFSAPTTGAALNSPIHQLKGETRRSVRVRGQSEFALARNLLTQIPHPRDRTIHGDIPIYYLQVPAHSVAKIRGPYAPDPPVWGVGGSQPDADGFCTWQLAFENGPVIYIRSQTVPKTGPGKHVIAPNGSEVFIPQSLLAFDIRHSNFDYVPIPPMASTPGPSGVMTLLSPRATVAFEGRTCKACQGKDVHAERCPTLQSDEYVCPWCNGRGGGHTFRCNGFL